MFVVPVNVDGVPPMRIWLYLMRDQNTVPEPFQVIDTSGNGSMEPKSETVTIALERFSPLLERAYEDLRSDNAIWQNTSQISVCVQIYPSREQPSIEVDVDSERYKSYQS
ncbi:MAG: hypothetical protein Alpg2KO_11770 [Alphaproteobacteria bacterium]